MADQLLVMFPEASSPCSADEDRREEDPANEKRIVHLVAPLFSGRAGRSALSSYSATWPRCPQAMGRRKRSTLTFKLTMLIYTVSRREKGVERGAVEEMRPKARSTVARSPPEPRRGWSREPRRGVFNQRGCGASLRDINVSLLIELVLRSGSISRAGSLAKAG